MTVVSQIIEVRGRVQGVGFRPFVFRLAQRLGVAGSVRNIANGVRIAASADPHKLQQFCSLLWESAPASADVREILVQASDDLQSCGFCLLDSERGGPVSTSLPLDLAPCAECLRELFEPNNRRYRYPFLSCQACGPRYTILQDLPFDRQRTAMAAFKLCTACAHEYADPDDRRFHAQTIACADCGPQLSTNYELAVDVLKSGGVIVIKGIGGYQLIADAAHEAAIARIRHIKARPAKPLAVMFKSLCAVQEVSQIDELEAATLQSSAAPIVLLQRLACRQAVVAANVAPAAALLGCMLPASPLHALLAHDIGRPLVVTSANRQGSPIVIQGRELDDDLAKHVDAVLDHNRPILRRADDAVMRQIAGRMVNLRLGRGLAPLSLPLAWSQPSTQSQESHTIDASMGVGAQEKCTQAVLSQGWLTISPHIGDLDSAQTMAVWQEGLTDLARLCGVGRSRYFGDRHIAYTASAAMRKWSLHSEMVQHHHAHVLACMAEHEWRGEVLGLAWDGAGAGGDGTLWGGEALLVSGTNCQRLAHLRPFSLPGGSQAIKEPRRSALGLLWELRQFDLLKRDFTPREWPLVLKALEQNLNCPRTSSMGRFFDAISALLGLCQIATYQEEAPSRLEALASSADVGRNYELKLSQGVIDWEDFIRALLCDLRCGQALAEIALGLHQALAKLAVVIADWVGIQSVVLTGGCFQNALLSQLVEAALTRAGYKVYTHAAIPPNDGGIAAGQALYGAIRMQRVAPCV